MTSLSDVGKELAKHYKKPVITDSASRVDPERLATGVFAFDLATGGGIPEGRIALLYGPESSMKTTLALKAIATAQKKYPNRRAVFVDVEGSFSANWATSMGVDVSTMGYVVPEYGEQMVDIVEAMMYADDVSVIVVDSLAALVTQQELDSSSEKAVVGNAGILINKFYRKVTRAMAKALTEDREPTLLCINQIRSKIGVMYGDPETMPGGAAFKFASSLTVRVYGKDEYVKEISKDLPAYKKISFILKKWKVPVVARQGEFLLALQPIAQYNLTVGGAYDWNTVLAYLKDLSMILKNEKAGWDLVDVETGEVENFDKQTDVRERMVNDPDFSAKVKKQIIDEVMKGEVGG